MVTANDILGAEALSLTEASKMLRGRGGKPAAIETIRRWANPNKGCRPAGKDGPVLILHTVRVNGELLTRREWVEAFEAERLRLGDRQPTGPVSRTPAKRAAGHRRAEKLLDEMGVR